MLKLEYHLKAKCSQLMSALLSLIQPHVIFVEYDMCSPLLFLPYLRMVVRLLEFGVKLVINQSVVPVDLELLPK
jgi:hypothetical protein